jgi:hypothetical protein
MTTQQKPFTAYVRTSCFSGGWEFATEAEAIGYIFDQFAHTRRDIESGRYGRSWIAFDCYRSYVEGPQGRVQARDVLFVDRLESH